MGKISVGHLRVLTIERIYDFPPRTADDSVNTESLSAQLRVVKDTFWVRLFTMGDLGFSEAYMYGEVECSDLTALFKIFLINRQNLANMESAASYFFTIPQKLTSFRFLNTLSNSRCNISAHYDISNAMFAGFLSSDMTYSCAIFEDLDGDLVSGAADHKSYNGGEHLMILNIQHTPQSKNAPGADCCLSPSEDPLYEAQLRKLKHIIDKAKISSDQRVLEIGSGWGSMAIAIAQTYLGTTVDTLTLSVQQQALATERIRDAGLQDRVTVHLMDYRAMPSSWKAYFDRVISVEMIEAVGAEYLEEYWRVLDWALKPEGGVGVVQVITIPEARFERYIAEIDFIRKWVIFPGGFLPTLTLLLKSMEKGSGGRLIVDSISNIGPHYARTLREWRKRFVSRFESVIVPALKAEHPTIIIGPRGWEEIEVFRRKWLCSCYCEVGFTARVLGDHIITFTREGFEGFGCDVFH
ncbi:CFS1-like protein [Suillus paluster]|uniref:CFS1-like protein n=1 Tax=Suillus paluster TaxID=48578 RepID=UPI001B85C4EA|nr:CFS1-like protein [Suillus paluster]KAG1745906.1 CFS1-like protein [Suillus paluster]